MPKGLPGNLINTPWPPISGPEPSSPPSTSTLFGPGGSPEGSLGSRRRRVGQGAPQAGAEPGEGHPPTVFRPQGVTTKFHSPDSKEIESLSPKPTAPQECWRLCPAVPRQAGLRGAGKPLLGAMPCLCQLGQSHPHRAQRSFPSPTKPSTQWAHRSCCPVCQRAGKHEPQKAGCSGVQRTLPWAGGDGGAGSRTSLGRGRGGRLSVCCPSCLWQMLRPSGCPSLRRLLTSVPGTGFGGSWVRGQKRMRREGRGSKKRLDQVRCRDTGQYRS